MTTIWSGGEGLSSYLGRSSLSAFQSPLCEAESDEMADRRSPRPRHSRDMYRDLSPAQAQTIRQLWAQGLTMSALGYRFQVDRYVIRRVVRPEWYAERQARRHAKGDES